MNYDKRGVSAQKEDVHKATEKLYKGLYPYAFCKLYEDNLIGDKDWVNVMHADGAGTKSILAYLYWKETGDLSVWKGIAQDAIVMNLDDLLCVGIYDNILFSSTIDRNKNRITGEILSTIINASNEFFDHMRTFGININYLGGETADVGDLVRTIAVNGTMAARQHKSKIISNEKIKPGNIIIGLASFGKSTYEPFFNSGIGSNGLTSARHDILGKYYSNKYDETYDETLNSDVVYIGKHKITDDIGKMLLSPTRTYAPFVKDLLENYFESICGLIHCSGGGQTKCMKYLPGNMKVIKDNLFDVPEIFNIIRKDVNTTNREMYQVFNMGHRLEIFTNDKNVDEITKLASFYNIESKVIGRVVESDKKELILKTDSGYIVY